MSQLYYSFSVSFPFTGLFYMCLKHLVDKYNIYHVYTPTKINAQIHSTAIMFFHIAIGMMQFQVFTYFYLRTGTSDVTTVTIIGVMITTTFLLGHSFLNCFRNINYLASSVSVTFSPLVWTTSVTSHTWNSSLTLLFTHASHLLSASLFSCPLLLFFLCLPAHSLLLVEKFANSKKLNFALVFIYHRFYSS